MIEHQLILGAPQRFHPPPVQINVNDLCSPIRQLHLLNYFLHSSFGVLSLNDTHLTSSSAKFIY
ncbi:hypothetical protein RhiirB3_461174 [Rhizophagus irregularis]|nr:hypothetical protein RhiirB3_461174 [Rhizophagus irregularis]